MYIGSDMYSREKMGCALALSCGATTVKKIPSAIAVKTLAASAISVFNS